MRESLALIEAQARFADGTEREAVARVYREAMRALTEQLRRRP